MSSLKRFARPGTVAATLVLTLASSVASAQSASSTADIRDLLSAYSNDAEIGLSHAKCGSPSLLDSYVSKRRSAIKRQVQRDDLLSAAAYAETSAEWVATCFGATEAGTDPAPYADAMGEMLVYKLEALKASGSLDLAPEPRTVSAAKAFTDYSRSTNGNGLRERLQAVTGQTDEKRTPSVNSGQAKTMSAYDLSETYLSNKLRFEMMYGETLRVSGNVVRVRTNGVDGLTLSVSQFTGDPDEKPVAHDTLCVLDDDQRMSAATLDKGDRVTVIGTLDKHPNPKATPLQPYLFDCKIIT